MKNIEFKPTQIKGAFAFYQLGVDKDKHYFDFVKMVKAIKNRELKELVIRLFRVATLQYNRAETYRSLARLMDNYEFSFDLTRSEQFPRSESDKKTGESLKDLPWNMN